jgi:hypothetical protein
MMVHFEVCKFWKFDFTDLIDHLEGKRNVEVGFCRQSL